MRQGESWQNFYHGTYSSMGAGSPKLLDNPVPTRRILLVNRPFFRIWGYFASPLLLARWQKTPYSKATFEPEPLKWNECSHAPLLLNNQIWRHIKISFHCRDGRYLGSRNYDFFQKKTICHSTSLWKYNFNIGFFKIKLRLWQ